MSPAFMVVATLTMVALGVCIGWVFGDFESEETERRISNDNPRNLPHAKLLTTRVAICLLAGYMVGGPTWDTLLMAGAMFMAVIPSHRFFYNKGADKPYWYMGLPLDLRDKDDSKYDTAMHLIASGLHLFNRKAPFWIATSLEAIAAVWLLYIFFTF